MTPYGRHRRPQGWVTKAASEGLQKGMIRAAVYLALVATPEIWYAVGSFHTYLVTLVNNLH